MKTKLRIISTAIVVSLLTTCTKTRESSNQNPKPPESDPRPGAVKPVDPFAPPPSGMAPTEFAALLRGTPVA